MDFFKRTWAEIDIDALLHNFKIIREHTLGHIYAVVKADAYGHGAAVVAPIFEKAGADGFAVSNIEEAVELRRNDIKKPILILGYTPARYAAELANSGIIQTVYSLDYASELSKEASAHGVTVLCHLKADTGMSRLGFDCRDGELSDKHDMLAACSLSNLSIKGIFTHFATADRDNDPNAVFTNAQYDRFCGICRFLEKNGVVLEEKHCCNSAGLMLHNDKHMTLSRPGIILYGLTPSAGLSPVFELKPAMSFKSTVSFVKKIKSGDTVSYGRNFTADRDMTVATVAAGYADGYPRALSGKADVLIHGKRAEILGNVCMDQLIVDVSRIDNVSEGDEVVLFGNGLPVEETAALCSTVNYELVCGVSRRVPRVYIKNGEPVKVADYILDK